MNPKMTKKESAAVAKLATRLAKLLQNLSVKYCGEDTFGPEIDFYAKDYEVLQRLEDEMCWWMT